MHEITIEARFKPGETVFVERLTKPLCECCGSEVNFTTFVETTVTGYLYRHRLLESYYVKAYSVRRMVGDVYASEEEAREYLHLPADPTPPKFCENCAKVIDPLRYKIKEFIAAIPEGEFCQLCKKENHPDYEPECSECVHAEFHEHFEPKED